ALAEGRQVGAGDGCGNFDLRVAENIAIGRRQAVERLHIDARRFRLGDLAPAGPLFAPRHAPRSAVAGATVADAADAAASIRDWRLSSIRHCGAERPTGRQGHPIMRVSWLADDGSRNRKRRSSVKSSTTRATSVWRQCGISGCAQSPVLALKVTLRS